MFNVVEMSEERIDGGYVIIARILFESAIWQADANLIKLFLYLVGKAQYQDKPKQFLDCVRKRGEVVTSMQEIADENEFFERGVLKKWSRPTISRMIKKLTQPPFEVLEDLADTYGTHLRICNYERYQNPKLYKTDTSETVPDETETPKDDYETVPDEAETGEKQECKQYKKGKKDNKGNKDNLITLPIENPHLENLKIPELDNKWKVVLRNNVNNVEEYLRQNPNEWLVEEAEKTLVVTKKQLYPNYDIEEQKSRGAFKVRELHQIIAFYLLERYMPEEHRELIEFAFEHKWWGSKVDLMMLLSPDNMTRISDQLARAKLEKGDQGEDNLKNLASNFVKQNGEGDDEQPSGEEGQSNNFSDPKRPKSAADG